MDPHTQTLALQEASSSGSRFSDLQSKLASFKKSHKKQSKTSTSQYEWGREKLDLETAGKTAQKVAAAAMGSFLALVGEEENGDVDMIAEASGLLGDMEKPSDAGKEMKEDYRTKFKELKGILDVLKGVGRGEELDGEVGGEVDAEKDAARKSVKPLFAEMLLRAREGLEEDGESLREEYVRERKEVRDRPKTRGGKGGVVGGVSEANASY
jgi:hypothetical protein